ncbi:MAG: uridine kinase [bacterium]
MTSAEGADADASPSKRSPVLVGVAGGSGSGKTSVVRAIVEGLRPDRVAVIHHDSYYRDFSHLRPDTRRNINFDHPDALETELLVRHLERLQRGQPVQVPVYDFTTHSRTDETLPVEPTEVIIVDGILVLAEPELRTRMDIKVFVDTDADVRFIRRLQRDMDERGRSLQSVIDQYETTVRPMHLEFVEPSKRWADVIVPVGGENRVAVDMLAARLGSLLTDRRQ